MSKVVRKRDRGDELEELIRPLLRGDERVTVARNTRYFVVRVFVNGER